MISGPNANALETCMLVMVKMDMNKPKFLLRHALVGRCTDDILARSFIHERE